MNHLANYIALPVSVLATDCLSPHVYQPSQRRLLSLFSTGVQRHYS